MRLQISKNSAEEKIISCLNEGHQILKDLWADYKMKVDSASFNPVTDMPEYHNIATNWINQTYYDLQKIFPTPYEPNHFSHRSSEPSVAYSGVNQEFGRLVYSTIPKYLERLRDILDNQLRRYTDLPLQDRLYIQDIDSFQKVRAVNRAMFTHLLREGYFDFSEDAIQLALEQILDVSFHKKDWGGEINDLYTANMVVNGTRRAAAFLLKGNGLRSQTLHIRDCGKNGDQIVRLFDSPAEIFIVQFVGHIDEMVVKDIESKVSARKAEGKPSHYLIMDGQDTAHLLFAYGKA